MWLAPPREISIGGEQACQSELQSGGIIIHEHSMVEMQ